MDDGKRTEAEEVHFQQAKMLAGDGGELRRRFVAGAFGDRGDLRDGHVADDDARRVDGHVAVQAFQNLCELPQLLVFRIVIDKLLNFVTAIVGFRERHFRICRNKFAKAVALLKRHAEGAGDVFDDGFRLQRSERADLHDVRRAVLFADVFDNDVTAAFAKVDVEVRRTDAFRIQKTFKKKAITNRIDVRDVHQISDDGACARTTARPERDADPVAVVQKVPHDQEVADEFRLLDDADFIVHTVDDDLLLGSELLRLRIEAVPFGNALFADFTKILLSVGAFGNGIFRIMVGRRLVVDGRQMDVAAFGDIDGVGHGLRQFGEERGHFVRILEPVAVAVETHAVGVLHGLLRADAEEQLMGLLVFLKQVMRVICDNQWDAFLLRDLHKEFGGFSLLLDAVVLDFKEEIVVAEDGGVFLYGENGAFFVAVEKLPRDFAGDAGRKADDVFVILAEKVLVDSRMVVIASNPSLFVQMAHVLVAFVSLCKADEMEALMVALVGVFLEVIAWRDIEFATHDGIDFIVWRDRGEFVATAHVAMVRNGQGGHFEVLAFLEHGFDFGGAVQQAEVAMGMEMDEWCGHGVFRKVQKEVWKLFSLI